MEIELWGGVVKKDVYRRFLKALRSKILFLWRICVESKLIRANALEGLKKTVNDGKEVPFTFTDRF